MCPFSETDGGPGDRLRDEEDATGREHAAQFRHRAATVVHDHEQPGSDDPVEAPIRLRERAHVIAHEAGVAQAPSGGMTTRQGDLRRRVVDAGDPESRMSRGDHRCVVSGPTANFGGVPGMGEIERGEPFGAVVGAGIVAERRVLRGVTLVDRRGVYM